MKDSQAVSTNRAVQSNWAALRAQIPVSVKPKAKKEKPEEVALAAAKVANKKKWERMLSSKILAVDCEMVGIGIGGKVSALARCSVVDFSGNVVYDNFVQPKGFVTDFRTKWSGIRKSDISARKAVSLEEVCVSIYACSYSLSFVPALSAQHCRLHACALAASFVSMWV